MQHHLIGKKKKKHVTHGLMGTVPDHNPRLVCWMLGPPIRGSQRSGFQEATQSRELWLHRGILSPWQFLSPSPLILLSLQRNEWLPRIKQNRQENLKHLTIRKWKKVECQQVTGDILMKSCCPKPIPHDHQSNRGQQRNGYLKTVGPCTDTSQR